MMIDFAQEQNVTDPYRYFSTKRKVEIDCPNETVTFLYVSTFS